jgi:Beta-lactamase superfamily domain
MGAGVVREGFAEALLKAHSHRRPVLYHLNSDTSWILSLPYPEGSVQPNGRCRYNLLIDPWLQGPQSDVASWFSTQWHAIESSVKTIDDLNRILADAEALCLGVERVDRNQHYVDVVAISHEFTDHCHRATLQELSPCVPIVAAAKAAELIRSWKYFENVSEIPSFSPVIDWRTTSARPLPSWLGISRLITEGNAMYYHSALVFCFQRPGAEEAEAVIYTPHGLQAATFSAVSSARPRVQTLAFLHGLHDVSLKWMKQLNLGAHNAIKAQKLLSPKYWVSTHDEVKKGGGLIKPILQRKAHTIYDALLPGQHHSGQPSQSNFLTPEDVAFTDLGNGQSLVLE